MVRVKKMMINTLKSSSNKSIREWETKISNKNLSRLVVAKTD